LAGFASCPTPSFADVGGHSTAPLSSADVSNTPARPAFVSRGGGAAGAAASTGADANASDAVDKIERLGVEPLLASIETIQSFVDALNTSSSTDSVLRVAGMVVTWATMNDKFGSVDHLLEMLARRHSVGLQSVVGAVRSAWSTIAFAVRPSSVLCLHLVPLLFHHLPFSP